MTATKPPTSIRSGHCGSGGHHRCAGHYGGYPCDCECGHGARDEAEAEPAEPRIMSLFSGYGGLDLAVRQVLGGEVIAHAEIEPAACRILEHRFPDVPNLGDVSAVDWSAVEPVDVLTGGFPCQDVSAAGKRAGVRPGTRSGLWAEMARAIQALRPPLVVIENVRGLLSADAHHPAHGDLEPCTWCLGDDEPVLLRALGAVLGDLADIGFDAEWVGLRAADIGAPHGRFRVFVTAWPAADADRFRVDRTGLHGSGERRGQEPADRGVDATDADQPGPQRCEPAWGRYLPYRRTTPHPEGDGRHEGRPEPARLIGGPDAALSGHDAAADAHGRPLREQPVRELRRGGAAVTGLACAAAPADAACLGRAGREQSRADVEQDGPESAHVGAPGRAALDWGPYGDAIRRWERCLGRPAPSPTEPGSKGQPRLSPTFVEWLMGLPAGWVTDVPGLTRNEQLKALGNGVVPQQAAEALRILLAAALEGSGAEDAA